MAVTVTVYGAVFAPCTQFSLPNTLVPRTLYGEMSSARSSQCVTPSGRGGSGLVMIATSP